MGYPETWCFLQTDPQDYQFVALRENQVSLPPEWLQDLQQVGCLQNAPDVLYAGC
jgi:hypothetical protein